MNKKISMLFVLVAALVLGMITSASAAEIKASGSWQIDAALQNNFDFRKDGAGATGEDKTFDIQQRMRTAFQFIANENLKAVLDTQIGTQSWGNGILQVGSGRSATVAGGSGAANGAAIALRKGYLEFKVPSTQVIVKAGFQDLALPAAFGIGSAIMDDQMAGIATVIPVNSNLSFVAGYARPVDTQAAGSTTTAANAGHGTSADAVFGVANVNLNGFSIQPFAAFANTGAKTNVNGANGFAAPNSSANEGMRAYWAGVAFTMTAFDPFKVMADLNYGKATYNNANSGMNEGGRSGWLFDAAVDYTGLSMVTPELFFAYTSGENGNSTKGSGKSERMPIFASPQNFAYGSFWMQGGDLLGSIGNTPNNVMGFWALGLSFKDIKFIDKLSNTVHFVYFKGTNNVDWLKETLGTNAVYGQTLTTKDSLFEVDLNTKYMIYDELALGLELGYIAANFDKDTWRAADANIGVNGSKDAYKAALFLQYNF